MVNVIRNIKTKPITIKRSEGVFSRKEYLHTVSPRKIFFTRKRSNECIYCIALCVNGIWEEVVVDDVIPVYKLSQLPAFVNFSKNENFGFWPILLEKAIAKVYGGY